MQAVVAVVSLKGGVGKTTVALGLAGASLDRGWRTLVVDLDPQANATTGLAPTKVVLTANDVLADGGAARLSEAVVPSGWDDLVDLVPSEPALEHRNRTGSKEHRLRGAMEGLADYGLVVLDCPPSLGGLTTSALTAAHVALVVTEPTIFAVTGAQQALAARGVPESIYVDYADPRVMPTSVRTGCSAGVPARSPPLSPSTPSPIGKLASACVQCARASRPPLAQHVRARTPRPRTYRCSATALWVVCSGGQLTERWAGNVNGGRA